MRWPLTRSLKPSFAWTIPTPQHFVWHRVKTVVHNLIIGSVWVDNYGDMLIRNLKTGDKCTIVFKQRSWWGKNYGEVEGTVLDKRGSVCRKLVGTWLEHIDVTPPDNGAGKVAIVLCVARLRRRHG